MSTIIETDADIQAGIAALASQAPEFAPVIAACGPVPLRRRPGGLQALIGIIIGQQVSVASAGAIHARFAARFPGDDAAPLAAASDEDFRACGFSGPKIRAARAIAEASLAGGLPFESLGDMTADDAHALLTKVKGIGPWTADIYLLICLGHADAFPAGDLAVQEAARLAFQLPARPSAKALTAMAEAWRPWRAIAARLLWRYYAVQKSREGLAGE